MSIWKRESSLEALEAECRNTLVSHVGIEFTELGEDCLRGRMPVDSRTRQPYGLLHGGGSVVLAETLGSIAANLCLADPNRMAVGLDINANHVRAMREGWVEGCARPLHIGATTQLWEIRIEDERGRLVCMSRLTMAVVNRG
ncbi:MAG: hotdog fold thioesterase [Pseudomonadota bacterium]|nr:hotdog fold thioesterase [Pseudomonadota bacterium]MED5501175.1 hotdog fold thioesterase [Pseudomonadota bacterium]